MSAKHKVATDALETLGTIIDETAKRDAIHLAVIAVEAGQTLNPGDHVGIVDGKAWRIHSAMKDIQKTVGIVDPFIRGNVSSGARFWLVIYPRQISSLRHVWSHPDIPEESVIDAETLLRVTNKLKYGFDSHIWLKEYADELGVTYNDLLQAAEDYVAHGDYLVRGGQFEGMVTNDEFWDHYERVTGKEVPEDKKGNFFSCSC